MWVTRDGVKPINRKIEAITKTKLPTYRGEFHQFMGVVNYYRGILPRKSHTLAPLTKITSNKSKFKWTKIEQDYFDKNERIVACGNLLTYTDFNETFKINTDSRSLTIV